MATTAGDQINGALRLLGVLAEGETPSAATSQDALTALNQIQPAPVGIHVSHNDTSTVADVINALVLMFVGQLLQPHFTVRDFSAAFWGGLVISLVSIAVNSLTGTGSARISVHRAKPPENKKPDDDDGPAVPVP